MADNFSKTPFVGLNVIDWTGADSTKTVAQAFEAIAGIQSTGDNKSNMHKIDEKLRSIYDEFQAYKQIEKTLIIEASLLSSASNFDTYIATVTGLTEYVNNTLCVIDFNVTNTNTAIAINVNNIGNIYLKKIGSNGNLINLSVKEINAKTKYIYLIKIVNENTYLIAVGEDYNSRIEAAILKNNAIKDSIVEDDYVGITDTEDSDKTKRVLLGNIINKIKNSFTNVFAGISHKSSHAIGGDDALTPSDIGAAPATHVDDKNNPHEVTVNQIGAIAKEEKGVAGGVATLNESSKLVEMPTADDVGAIDSSQKGVANGVATLDSNSKLVQMPNLADVGGSNENLLHNWYFADPINQRGWISGATSYQYTLDRWFSNDVNVTVNDGFVTLAQSGTSNIFFIQRIEPDFYKNAIAGKTITVSALLRDKSLKTATVTAPAFKSFSSSEFNVDGLMLGAFSLETEHGFRIFPTVGHSFDIVAVKAEFGSQQTLAKLENGNWVLNDPPPDKNIELLKCCMSTADSGDNYANNKMTAAAINAFGEHSKPLGIYTGNGSATARTIDTGGVGNVCLIYGWSGVAIVTPNGAILGGGDAPITPRSLNLNSIIFIDGVLTIKTADAAVNTNGTSYVYQVL